MKSPSAVLGPLLVLLLCPAAFGQSLAGVRGPDDGMAALPDRISPAGQGLRPVGCPPPIVARRAGFVPVPDEWPSRGARPPAGRVVKLSRHVVGVRIVDGVAVTEIDQTFHNDTGVAVEGMYICPIPEGAVVRGFSIFMGDREVRASVMERTKAREVYDRITRRRRDPGIVELVGRQVQTRIFPIPARGDMRVKTRYAQILARKNGRYGTRVPFRELAGQCVTKASISVKARSAWPIRLAFSRGFPLEGRSEHDERRWAGRFDAEDFEPRRDLDISCITGRPEPGLALRVHKTANGERFFMAVLAAGERALVRPEL
ncbi:MAG: VIT domain-containing protein, partial [Planctomycetota bacterium]